MDARAVAGSRWVPVAVGLGAHQAARVALRLGDVADANGDAVLRQRLAPAELPAVRRERAAAGGGHKERAGDPVADPYDRRGLRREVASDPDEPHLAAGGDLTA
jgi:hypothetical protein